MTERSFRPEENGYNNEVAYYRGGPKAGFHCIHFRLSFRLTLVAWLAMDFPASKKSASEKIFSEQICCVPLNVFNCFCMCNP